MSSTTDKAKGIGNEVAGKAKQAVGDLSGDKTLRDKGVAQEQKGIGQKAVGDAKTSIKKIVDNS